MQHGKKSTIFIGIGILFLANAIIGRYIVLPGFLAGLEAGRGTIEAVQQTVPVWKIVRYLVWAYSFKLGIYLIIVGTLLRSSITPGRFRLIWVGGIVYLSVAYLPLPGPYPLFFGIGGSMITLFLVLIIRGWSHDRDGLEGDDKIRADYRLIGYFFLAMATYNFCPLLGVKAFALYPEKMMRYGLQSEAAAFATRIMVELVLGWLFVFLSHFRKFGFLQKT